MINFAEVPDGEIWELFTRDFLAELGFYIESSPDRGADAGKDLLAREDLSGNLGGYEFRWLVSCKHYAVSGRAIGEPDEQNILERIEAFEADGFLGFYSTVPSAGLNTRLKALRDGGKIKDFRIFDHKLIENYLIRVGYSVLLMRYFPESYKVVKPLHAVAAHYEPLNCRACGKDLLAALYQEPYRGLIGFARHLNSEDTDYLEPRRIEEVYWACKGKCDRALSEGYRMRGMVTGWEDISDLVIPAFYLQFVFSAMNSIRDGKKVFTDEAYEQLKTFIFALAQRVLRETTPKEQERVGRLIKLSFART